MTAAVRRSFVALGLLVTLAGCATSAALRRGEEHERRQDYDRAVAEYTNALRRNPNDTRARLALDRAKIRASADYFQRARRLAALGKYDEALVAYEAAAELNPSNGDVDAELRSTRNQLRAKVAVAREGRTELQALIERSRDLPADGLALPVDVKMPGSLTFREASSRDVFLAVARFGNISIAFDPAFREAPVTIDLRNASLDQALSTVADATRTFFRVNSPRNVLVIPDTPAKRREFEEEVVRTFYLSNADLKETQDLLRLVLDARRISPTTATNAITIKDTPERISAAAKVIAAIDKARPEVIIDVELLEVDRTRLTEYGLQLASSGSAGLDGSISAKSTDASPLSLRSLRNLTQSDMLLANFPSLYYRLLKSDNNTRTLANPQLRTSEGTSAQARFGERIPVPVTVFTPLTASGGQAQPITSYNYENIGVNIDITPRTHHDDEVTLALKVNVQSISGTGFNGLPTFGNREINTVIRLKDGETNMLAGLIRDDERRVLEGIPGLSDVPVIGRLFAHSRTETKQTDVILTLTPHIIRVLDVDESDLRAFRVGRDAVGGAGGGVEGSLPAELPRQGQGDVGNGVRPVRPIQPPSQSPAPAPSAPAPQQPQPSR